METSENIYKFGLPAVFLGILGYCFFVELAHAPLSAEAANRAMISEKSGSYTMSHVQAKEVEELNRSTTANIVNENVFGFDVVCMDPAVESSIHGALELLANSIGKDKIPVKYIEMDLATRTVTPESIRWAWQSYWAKSKSESVVCIPR